jgi:hypothetical protein
MRDWETFFALPSPFPIPPIRLGLWTITSRPPVLDSLLLRPTTQSKMSAKICQTTRMMAGRTGQTCRARTAPSTLSPTQPSPLAQDRPACGASRDPQARGEGPRARRRGRDASAESCARPRAHGHARRAARGARHILVRVLQRRLCALQRSRTLHRKALSTAVWHPALARAHVSAARGIHFASLGHSVARPASGADGSHNAVAEALRAPAPEHKRLELLPEEALYLIERGSMTCALAHSEDDDGKVADARAPMSVQQAFAAMIGTEGLSLEKYQVRGDFPLPRTVR